MKDWDYKREKRARRGRGRCTLPGPFSLLLFTAPALLLEEAAVYRASAPVPLVSSSSSMRHSGGDSASNSLHINVSRQLELFLSLHLYRNTLGLSTFAFRQMQLGDPAF
jgi:hypothetical protein